MAPLSVRQLGLAKAKDGHQGLVDAPLLLRAYPGHQFTESAGADGADLLDQDAGSLAEQVDFRAE